MSGGEKMTVCTHVHKSCRLNFTNCRDLGLCLVLQVFEGNQDAETPVLALFNTSTVARYIRINPQTWYQNGTQGDICLRAEVLGCTLPGTWGQLLQTVFLCRFHFFTFSLFGHYNTHLSHFTDPNNIYAWQTKATGSRDKLDFRHHNYKEMRKVKHLYVLSVIWWSVSSMRFKFTSWKRLV